MAQLLEWHCKVSKINRRRSSPGSDEPGLLAAGFVLLVGCAAAVGFPSWFFMLVLLIMRVLCHFLACKSHYFRQAFMFTLTRAPRRTRRDGDVGRQSGSRSDALSGVQSQGAGKAIGNSSLQLLLLLLLLFFFSFFSPSTLSPTSLWTGFVSCLLRNIIVVYFVALFA